MKPNLNNILIAAEIGCGDLRSSEFKKYSFEKVYLFEPNILFYQDIVNKIIDDNRITTFNCAVSNKDYIGKFYNYGYTSFLKGSSSFVNLWSWDALGKNPPSDPEVFYKDLITNVVVLDSARLDKNIDFLILTNNGCEYNVLQNLQNRPKYIKVKYYLHTIKQMQYFNTITQWMLNNRYSGYVLDKNTYNTYNDILFERQ